MVLKKMIDLCKQHGQIIMYRDSRGGAWLSDGMVMAKMPEPCELESEDILYIMDLPSEIQEQISMSDMDFTADDEMQLFNIADDTPLSWSRFSINCDGLSLQPFGTRKGMLFIDCRNLKVFSDVGCKQYYLSELFGVWVVQVFVDSHPIGIIMPHRVDLETMKAWTTSIDSGVTLAKANKFNDCGGKQYSLIDDE